MTEVKEGLIKTLFVAALSVLGWAIQTQIHTNLTHENRITIIEETKADKEEVNELHIQITRQTVILENQSRIMEQQQDLLKHVLEKD